MHDPFEGGEPNGRDGIIVEVSNHRVDDKSGHLFAASFARGVEGWTQAARFALTLPDADKKVITSLGTWNYTFPWRRREG